MMRWHRSLEIHSIDFKLSAFNQLGNLAREFLPGDWVLDLCIQALEKPEIMKNFFFILNLWLKDYFIIQEVIRPSVLFIWINCDRWLTSITFKVRIVAVKHSFCVQVQFIISLGSDPTSHYFWVFKPFVSKLLLPEKRQIHPCHVILLPNLFGVSGFQYFDFSFKLRNFSIFAFNFFAQPMDFHQVFWSLMPLYSVCHGSNHLDPSRTFYRFITTLTNRGVESISKSQSFRYEYRRFLGLTPGIFPLSSRRILNRGVQWPCTITCSVKLLIASSILQAWIQSSFICVGWTCALELCRRELIIVRQCRLRSRTGMVRVLGWTLEFISRFCRFNCRLQAISECNFFGFQSSALRYCLNF